MRPSQIDVPPLDAEIERLSEGPLGLARERRYMQLAPWVPLGNFTASTVVSKAVDLDGVIWNPMIGADLTSFQFK